MSEQKSVLLVEDDKPIIDILQHKLKLDGYNFMIATNGEQGLDIALKNHPDLIILDIIMPKMDGITMLKKLRGDIWGKNAKVIILTNLSNPTSELEASQLDVSDYMIKTDLKLSEVETKIKNALQ